MCQFRVDYKINYTVNESHKKHLIMSKSDSKYFIRIN